MPDAGCPKVWEDWVDDYAACRAGRAERALVLTAEHRRQEPGLPCWGQSQLHSLVRQGMRAAP